MSLILFNDYDNNERIYEAIHDPQSHLYYIFRYFQNIGCVCKPFEDNDDPQDASAILFMEMPVSRWSNYKYFLHCVQKGCQEKMLSFLMESPTHFPWVWKDQELHKQFSKILTWNDSMVDGNKYLKAYYAQIKRFSHDYDNPFSARKLLTLVATNKMIDHPYELFSYRREAIRAFERLCPYDFDLFGQFWNQPTSGIWWNQRRTEREHSFLVPSFPSSRGACIDKIETLSKYKFCISYENMLSNQEHSGYITEKIFDCFFAGCVPIYLGDLNISKVIPSNLFIHRADFSSYDQLYGYIVNMPEEAWQGYRLRTKSYLESELYRNTFSQERFMQTLAIAMEDNIYKRSRNLS